MQPTFDPAMNPEAVVSPVLLALTGLLGLGALVCWIIEVVTAFKKEEKPLMGILSIVLCSLGGFVIGWIHAKKWGITKLMVGWTILAILVGVLYGVLIASASAAVGDEMRRQSMEIQSIEIPELEAPAPAPAP